MVSFKLNSILLIILSLFSLKTNSQVKNNNFDKSLVFKYLDNKGLVDGNLIGGVNSSLVPYYFMDIKYDYKVDNLKDLLLTLKKVKSSDVIFISGDVTINLSKVSPLILPKGITLLSDRGKNGSKGALLLGTAMSVRSMIKVGGSGVKIIGLRLYGGDTSIYPNGKKILNDKTKRNTYGTAVTEGITSSYSALEIANCEIYGWSHAGIFLSNGVSNVNIHHNYIHDNRRYGLGYGIGLKGAQAFVKANLFDNNRHDIAGTGEVGTSYEASYNIVIGDKDDHLFDMHGGTDRKDNTDIAGTDINIHNNYFYTRKGTRSIVIRGIPQKQALIMNNKILESDKEVESRSLKLGIASEKLIMGFIGQRNAFGNIKEGNNKIILIKK